MSSRHSISHPARRKALTIRSRLIEDSAADVPSSTSLRIPEATAPVTAAPPGTLRARETAFARGASRYERIRCEMTRGLMGRICAAFHSWIASHWARSSVLIRARISSIASFISSVLSLMTIPCAPSGGGVFASANNAKALRLIESHRSTHGSQPRSVRGSERRPRSSLFPAWKPRGQSTARHCPSGDRNAPRGNVPGRGGPPSPRWCA